jgi:hypothetical protein
MRTPGCFAEAAKDSPAARQREQMRTANRTFCHGPTMIPEFPENREDKQGIFQKFSDLVSPIFDRALKIIYHKVINCRAFHSCDL